MKVTNKTAATITVANRSNRVVINPGEEKELRENCMAVTFIHSDEGAVEIVRDHWTRTYKTLGKIEAVELQGDDGTGCQPIAIIMA